MSLLLQANLNHCRGAQDLFVQSLAEWDVGLGVAAEPYVVPDHPHWLGDVGGTVALAWRSGHLSPPLSLAERGDGFVAARWGGLTVVGCYASPSRGLPEFERFLDEVGCCVARSAPRPVLVLGDFNAWSTTWGSPRNNARGYALEGWAAGFDLRVLNTGSEHTCVRWNGASIVDVTFATPSAARLVSGWRVVVEAETLSDHRYISMVVSASPDRPRHERPSGTPPRRWARRRLNSDVLVAAAIAVSWSGKPDPASDAETWAGWFGRGMASICDAAMPRAGPRTGRRSAYWWSGEIADLRTACVRARRRYARARRRRRADAAVVQHLYGGYRDARDALRTAIRRAKSRAWEDLLRSVDEHPWGLPYRVVLRKLRPWTPPITASLDPQVLRGVVDGLFPVLAPAPSPPPVIPPSAWTDDLGVTEEEIAAAVRKLRDVAPGPDGVPGRAWALARSALADDLVHLFNSCMRSGVFPSHWKTASLVLLRKPGRPAESPSGYRPICLLDEAGKLFERVLAARLVGHLSREGPDLSDRQFGFREGRSTIDAVLRVRDFSDRAVSGGGAVLAVGIDIVNAFNALPWEGIRAGLEYHRVPPYLKAVVGDYLRDRWIQYPGRGGGLLRRQVHCGVPQGSVLGPLLWNLAYDAVLRTEVPFGAGIVCYADDTLVLARGYGWEAARDAGLCAVGRVVRRIRALGLEVAPDKTEAMWFCRSRRWAPPRCRLRAGDVRFAVGYQMKYLGLTLDCSWNFNAHFVRLAPRLGNVSGALGRLLPNIGGANDSVRRLYVGVVLNMALYGAPVWANSIRPTGPAATILRRARRTLAIRVARGYRTISHEAAGLLAGIPPLELLARMRRRQFLECRATRPGGASGDAALRRRATEDMLREWALELRGASSGLRTVEAVLPCFDAWLEGGAGRLTFRVTQVLTGHGCFGEYLHRIRRRDTPQCIHCGADQDSAQHTLEHCPRWERARRELVGVVGASLELSAVVRAMVGSRDGWRAVASFCERVMLQKEAAGRRHDRARRG